MVSLQAATFDLCRVTVRFGRKLFTWNTSSLALWILLSQLDIASLFSLGKEFPQDRVSSSLKTNAFKKPFDTAVLAGNLAIRAFKQR
jgi:hypothetical protein